MNMPKIDWKSAIIGAVAVYGLMYWRAKAAAAAPASTAPAMGPGPVQLSSALTGS